MTFDFSPIWISLKTALTATVLVLILGVAAASWRAGRRSRLWDLMDGLLLLPLVLPPTVVGFFLLVLFGRNGPLGRLLWRIGVTVVFSWPATVIAAAVVAFPLMYLTVRGAFEQLDPSMLEAARTLGAPEWEVLTAVALPLIWPGVLAGTVLAFARALGEFGATLMLAGNIPGRTETIPVAIFFAIEAGDTREALGWAAVVFAISLAVLAAMGAWTRYQRSYLARGFAKQWRRPAQSAAGSSKAGGA
jgi:molybdate transport system permease protein